DVIKVNKAFSGRVTLPGYSASRLNATMEISSLRTNDSGTYHCQVVVGSDYERDTVPLLVSGKCSGHAVSSRRSGVSLPGSKRSLCPLLHRGPASLPGKLGSDGIAGPAVGGVP
ncbi:hypothetical protein GOODEAATRI_005126, partial [Goodea atripinnis]